MFRLSQLFLSVFIFLFPLAASAQDLQILFPQEGQQVRGTIKVQYTGIPEGGYAIIKLDGNFFTATSLNTLVLNTFPPIFIDGTHRLTIAAINEGGKKLSEKTVSFEVANTRVEVGGEQIPLRHYVNDMRKINYTDRYRTYGETNVEFGPIDAPVIFCCNDDPSYIYQWAPLDVQFGAMMRRIVRDVNLYHDFKGEGFSSANIATSVKEASQRQRIRTPPPNFAPAVKEEWDSWAAAAEAGYFRSEMTLANGETVNAKRREPPIALVDFLSTFPHDPVAPDSTVSPGSTWATQMTFFKELVKRESLTTPPAGVPLPEEPARMTFTGFENYVTPHFEKIIPTPREGNRRTAKLEAQFELPQDEAEALATTLVNNARAVNELNALVGPAFSPISAIYSRVIWFDYERHRVLRSEDKVSINFSVSAPSDNPLFTPGTVAYESSTVTWFDDSVPIPTDKWVRGGGGAHGPIPQTPVFAPAPGTRDLYIGNDEGIEKVEKPTVDAPSKP